MSDPRAVKLKDPFFHIREIQGVRYMPRAQEKIIKAVRDHKNVAISACHGIGKTFTMGRIVPWFLTTHPHSNVLTTAPTNRQVNSLLWNEIRNAYNNSKFPLGGQIMETPNWKITDTWFAIGYSPEKGKSNAREGESSASSFQGFHAADQLIVIDEATGVPRQIWKMIQSMATSANARIAAIGNPTTKNCEFYEKFSSRAWHKVKLSCFDSPNMTVNGFETVDDVRREMDLLMSMSDEEMRHRIQRYKVVQHALVTAQWVMTMAMPDEWGIDSIPFKTRVLGEWPDIEIDVFFQEHVIEEACLRKEAASSVQCRYWGVDPARFGTDKSVMTIIENYTQTERHEMSQKDTMEVAGYITKSVLSKPRVPDEKILVDATGVGSGVVDRLKENQRTGLIPKSIKIVELHNGNSAAEDSDPKWKQEKDESRWANKKAKMIDLLAEDMKANLCLNASDIYKRELPGIIYSYDGKGRKVVESKDAYKKRTGKPSPDNSESLAYANYGRYVVAKKETPTPRVTAL
jgi:phage terminase large subunit